MGLSAAFVVSFNPGYLSRLTVARLFASLQSASDIASARAASLDSGHEGIDEVKPIPSALLAEMEKVLALNRQVIVLLYEPAERTENIKFQGPGGPAISASRQAVIPGAEPPARYLAKLFYHQSHMRFLAIERSLEKLTLPDAGSGRFLTLGAVLDFVESEASLYDADRLIFKDLLRSLQQDLDKSNALPAVKMSLRIGDDLEALAQIEKTYDKEVVQIFGGLGASENGEQGRGITSRRERWADYVTNLQRIYSREGILKAAGLGEPTTSARPDPAGSFAKPLAPTPSSSAPSSSTPSLAPPSKPSDAGALKSIVGYNLPPKTLVLTFDDGPHKTFTAEISDILKQYGAPAVFFEVGENLGKVSPDGRLTLGTGAQIARQLVADGYVIANHSMTHPQLNKIPEASVRREILLTDQLLKSVDANRSPLFRFPFGARSAAGEKILKEAGLQSVLWNIDSLDWADPVPNSIVNRVLKQVGEQGRGIILFHDIHDRAVRALPKIMERLVADGYQFAGWDGKAFTVPKSRGAPPAQPSVNTAVNTPSTPSTPLTPLSSLGKTSPISDQSGHSGHFGQLGQPGQSWALVVGIDKYQHWPQLAHAVKDAEGVRQTLVKRLGFNESRVVTLKNKQASRDAILAELNGGLTARGMRPQDRLFVFFAGHGTTRHLSSGRDLGYIVPEDASVTNFASDAIAMTELQNVSESLQAKQVFFVMDACYSGLGLSRGGPGNFLRDNAGREGRQMLTAGGADQTVADNGPNGHSIFTWTLLQALNGKADLNADGYITATEIAAYVAPAVASVSTQTPAFGSLPGSEGGDFVFEIAANEEALGPKTAQLTPEAIALNQQINAHVPRVEPARLKVQKDRTQNTLPNEKNAVDAKRVQSQGSIIGRMLSRHDAPVNVNVNVNVNASPALVQAAGSAAMKVPAVLVKDLQGHDQKIKAPAPAVVTDRQLAIRLNEEGLALYKEKSYKEAETHFLRALTLKPDFALAANNLGFIYLKEGDVSQAIAWFERTLRLEPDSLATLINLGDAQLQALDNEGARKSFSRYLELAPNGPAAEHAFHERQSIP